MSLRSIHNGSPNAPTILLLAHGAGAGMDTEFMRLIAEACAGPDIEVIRFEFPYMTLQREQGKKRAPNTQKVLLKTFEHELLQLRSAKIYIGGKSMGGRIASMLADSHNVSGLICLGYPFHPPGKPDKLRTKHLEHLQCRTLILQGERDPFGKKEEVKGYTLSKQISIEWVPDGEHSFKPRKSSGTTQVANLKLAAHHIRQFIQSQL